MRVQRLDHYSIRTTDLDRTIHQVFFEDPSGVTLELNFPAAEAPGAKPA